MRQRVHHLLSVALCLLLAGASAAASGCSRRAWSTEIAREYEEILDKIATTAALAEGVTGQTSAVWSSAIRDQSDFNLALQTYRDSKPYKEAIAALDKERNDAERRVRLSQTTLTLPAPALASMMASYECMSRLVAYAKAPTGSLQSFNQETGRVSNECAAAIATARAFIPLPEGT